MDASFIFSLVILLFSVIIHEVAHGYAALMQGDKTAEYAGRLTLNPIPHIDPVGTILLPFLSLSFGGFLFGWAKPVPFNPYNLRNKRWGEAIVAIAGPLSNLLLALIFGLIIRFYILPSGNVAGGLAYLSDVIVKINIGLAVFNLVPIPPLDGSKILSSILPASFMRVRQGMERFGFLGVIIFLTVLWRFVTPVIPWMYQIITGAHF